MGKDSKESGRELQHWRCFCCFSVRHIPSAFVPLRGNLEGMKQCLCELPEK
ncbi:hypothetical protein GCWU000341_02049 [Oribacterium sp. oral taxon 078 str. F0262]|nr:hypothetical protein GCWU000341_02049 [Oribacterium sp. oral taxon 078 str. F0262]